MGCLTQFSYTLLMVYEKKLSGEGGGGYFGKSCRSLNHTNINLINKVLINHIMILKSQVIWW